eukprot:4927645-Pleurochrysis_carterae.AAC.3
MPAGALLRDTQHERPQLRCLRARPRVGLNSLNGVEKRAAMHASAQRCVNPQLLPRKLCGAEAKWALTGQRRSCQSRARAI